VTSSPYIIFTGEYRIDYIGPAQTNQTDVPTEFEVQLASLHHSRPIFSRTLTRGRVEERLTFPCGLIDFAGSFLFRVVDKETDAILFQTRNIQAVWPRMMVQLPKSRIKAASESIVANLSVNSVADGGSMISCETFHGDANYSISMEYHGEASRFDVGSLQNGSDVGGGGSDGIRRKPKTTHVTYFNDLMSISGTGLSVTFPCTATDQAGVYRVAVRSHKDRRTPMSISEPIMVDWSKEYRLSSLVDVVQPCIYGLVISFERPACLGNEDRIRIYRQIRNEDVSIATPVKLVGWAF